MATDDDPDQRVQTELEAAETLLQLKDIDTADTSQENEDLLPVDTPRQDDFTKDMAEAEKFLDTVHDENEDLLPVDAPKHVDFTKDMAEAANVATTGTQDNNDDDEEDDDATVIYELDIPSTTETTPKKRQSDLQTLRN